MAKGGKPTISPWIEQIHRKRVGKTLTKDYSTQVAIVGGGIAGATTAYFLLTKTRKSVALFEAGKVAHGATGHNAGQLVSYFERPFHDIVDEFGLRLAADGQRAVDSAWELLDEIVKDLNLKTPIHTFTGFAGCVDKEELFTHLENKRLKKKAGLKTEECFVSKRFLDSHRIPYRFRGLYRPLPHMEVLDMLETKDDRYIAVLVSKKGVANSARFTEELISALLKRYKTRFTVFEQTKIARVHLFTSLVRLETARYDIAATHVILCTNGFEGFHIINHAGKDIDASFHHLVKGSVGYMAGFYEHSVKSPVAISYLPTSNPVSLDVYDAEPYFYLTRRPFDGGRDDTNLICIGGPEHLVEETGGYRRTAPYSAEAKTAIDRFVKRTYRHAKKRFTYSHLWHGLMGYTPNGIRCVGFEPINHRLLYNLGCNGVGILPSIAGSSRIARLIQKGRLPKSIFDPVDFLRDGDGHYRRRQKIESHRLLLASGIYTALFPLGIALLWFAYLVFKNLL